MSSFLLRPFFVVVRSNLSSVIFLMRLHTFRATLSSATVSGVMVLRGDCSDVTLRFEYEWDEELGSRPIGLVILYTSPIASLLRV